MDDGDSLMSIILDIDERLEDQEYDKAISLIKMQFNETIGFYHEDLDQHYNTMKLDDFSRQFQALLKDADNHSQDLPQYGIKLDKKRANQDKNQAIKMLLERYGYGNIQEFFWKGNIYSRKDNIEELKNGAQSLKRSWDNTDSHITVMEPFDFMPSIQKNLRYVKESNLDYFRLDSIRVPDHQRDVRIWDVDTTTLDLIFKQVRLTYIEKVASEHSDCQGELGHEKLLDHSEKNLAELKWHVHDLLENQRYNQAIQLIQDYYRDEPDDLNKSYKTMSLWQFESEFHKVLGDANRHNEDDQFLDRKRVASDMNDAIEMLFERYGRSNVQLFLNEDGLIARDKVITKIQAALSDYPNIKNRLQYVENYPANYFENEVVKHFSEDKGDERDFYYYDMDTTVLDLISIGLREMYINEIEAENA